jgi:hypothetical protein
MNELGPGLVLSSLGTVVRVQMLAPGVYWTTTAEHGGYVLHVGVVRYWLSQAASVRGVVDGEWVCFEEDCAWAMVVHEHPEWAVEPLDMHTVDNILQQEYPDYLTEMTGGECSENELLLRQTSFRVMDKCCTNCLFGPDKLISDERKEAMLAEIVRNDDFFVCHEGSEQGQKICCRAFYERYRSTVSSLRVAQMLGHIYPGSFRFVAPVEDVEAIVSAKEEGEL